MLYNPTMRILVTNDDGVFSPALAALVRAAMDFGEVAVAAPVGQQSACGHGLTVHGVVEVEAVDLGLPVAAWAVHGTPADCVKIAWRELLNERPDLVLSGINLGANIGINALYSGTVAGAAEAVILGAPAAAFSIETVAGVDNDLAAAERWTRALLGGLLGAGALDGRGFCNINYPRGCSCTPAGVRVARQCDSTVYERYERLDDHSGRRRYRLTGDYGFHDPAADTDAAAIAEGYITLTPMAIDLSAHRRLEFLEGISFDYFNR